jgi:phosphatidylserine/phosphatidylglycerophosphate/cardiolipin synthase-like enzyme
VRVTQWASASEHASYEIRTEAPSLTISIRAFGNEDDALAVWSSDVHIDGCLGFAVERRQNGVTRVLKNYVGFPGHVGGPRPSTEWPFQRWKWTDHSISANDRVAYRVRAMIGAPDGLAPGPASPWSDELSGTAGSPIGAHFNRGIVATQWVARRLGENTVENHPGTRLLTAVASPGDALRDELSGPLRVALIALLDQAIALGQEIYVALFELADPELIERLLALGQRAHVLLANGTHEKPKGMPMKDENEKARKRLAGHVDLSNRMLRSGLAHNKFMVIVDGGNPTLVWTGSTNWTPSGLCTQANNALVIDDAAVAADYLAQWHLLKTAGDAHPQSLRLANATEKRFKVGESAPNLGVWFTPLAGRLDLQDARTFIDAAQQAILFLVFNPGPADTVLNAIQAKVGTLGPGGNPLYIRGVANQDPGGKKKPIFLYDERGIVPRGMEIVMPAAIDDPFARWTKELLKAPSAHAMVHSKCVVIDPLGDHPVVMTGSHNLGPAASGKNDDNLVIVEGDQALAQAYMVNILGVYGNYRWRENQLREHPAQFTDLSTTDRWQEWGLKGDGAAERRFWFG